MSSTLKNNNICTVCNSGVMVKPKPVHTYDYSTEGFILKYCNNSSCSVCNDLEEIIPETNIVVTRFSNRFIKKFLDSVCNKGRNFSYQQKSVLVDRLCDKNIDNPYHLIDLLMLELKELGVQVSQDFAVQMIYSPVGADLCFDSWE